MKFGSAGGTHDDELDKTMIECWHRPEGKDEENKIDFELNLPFNGPGEFQDMKTGGIVKNPSDIQLDEDLSFYVFRCVVGRSFVMKRSQLEAQKPRSVPYSDYDSIYVHEDQGEEA